MTSKRAKNVRHCCGTRGTRILYTSHCTSREQGISSGLSASKRGASSTSAQSDNAANLVFFKEQDFSFVNHSGACRVACAYIYPMLARSRNISSRSVARWFWCQNLTALTAKQENHAPRKVIVGLDSRISFFFK